MLQAEKVSFFSVQQKGRWDFMKEIPGIGGQTLERVAPRVRRGWHSAQLQSPAGTALPRSGTQSHKMVMIHDDNKANLRSTQGRWNMSGQVLQHRSSPPSSHTAQTPSEALPD